MDTASWRVIAPASFSRIMSSCTAFSAGTLRSCDLLKARCQASLSGYQARALGVPSGSPSTCTHSVVALRCVTRRRGAFQASLSEDQPRARVLQRLTIDSH
jgi:hypothetical protein